MIGYTIATFVIKFGYLIGRIVLITKFQYFCTLKSSAEFKLSIV